MRYLCAIKENEQFVFIELYPKIFTCLQSLACFYSKPCLMKLHGLSIRQKISNVNKTSNVFQYECTYVRRALCSLFSLGTLLIVLCSMKMFRSAFSDSPKQYLIVTFTFFLFKYDFHSSSETFLIDYFFIAILFNKVSILVFTLFYLILQFFADFARKIHTFGIR